MEKYFECQYCYGNYKEEYKIYHGNNEICQWCWNEINDGLTTPEKLKKEFHNV